MAEVMKFDFERSYRSSISSHFFKINQPQNIPSYFCAGKNRYGLNIIKPKLANTASMYVENYACTGAGTILGWAYTTWSWNGTVASDGQPHNWITYYDANPSINLYLMGGNMTLYIQDPPSISTLTTTSYLISAYTWFLIGITWSKALNFMKIWKDGVQVATGPLGTDMAGKSVDLTIGGVWGSTTELFGGIYDSLVVRDDAISDFSEYLATPPEYTTVSLPVQDPKILMKNDVIDIYALGYVKGIQDITEQKTFKKDKMIDNEYSIEVKNFDDFFSVNNPLSFFSGTNWLYSTLRVKDESNTLIWDGLIENIERNHNNKIAKVVSISSLTKSINSNVAYESSGWETPASAIYNIFVANGFTAYDNTTIQRSISQLTAAACYVKVNINKSDKLNLFGAIEKIAEYGCCDCYVRNGKVYVKHYSPFTGGISIYIDDGDLLTAPTVTLLLKEIINQYKIGYTGHGENAIFDDDGGDNIAVTSRALYDEHILPELKSGDGEQIKFKDAVSAKYIGNCYIRRTHKNISTAPQPLTQIQFELPYDFRNYISLDSYFRLTFSDESWTNKIFEVFSTTRSEISHKIKITAVEVDE